MTCNYLGVPVASDVLAFWSKENIETYNNLRGNVTGLDLGDPDGSSRQLTYYWENAAASSVSSVLATVSQHQQALCNQSPSLHFAVKIQSTAFIRSPTNQTIVQLSFGLAKYKTKIKRQYINKLFITIIIDAIIAVISSL